MGSSIVLKNNIESELNITHSDDSGAVTITSEQLKNIRQVDTIADLRAMTDTQNTIWVSGYHTKDDGAFGSNIFRWNPTSTEADNGGTIIKLDSIATGRYELQYSGSVNVKWFGAVGDGVTDDTDAIQAALDVNKGIVFFPKGSYLISSALTITSTGKKLIGESINHTYLKTASGTSHDIVQVNEYYCDISGFNFRPGDANNVCLRIQSGFAHIHDNRFLSAVNNSGNAIELDDNGGATAGAYTHIIKDNEIGYDGYAFGKGIYDVSTNGITSCKIQNNNITSDVCIKMTKGGANTYIGNLLKSSTGTYVSPAGIGIDAVTSEMVLGNYFERLQYAVLLRNTSTTLTLGSFVNNHYDNCTNRVYPTGGGYNYIELEAGEVGVKTSTDIIHFVDGSNNKILSLNSSKLTTTATKKVSVKTVQNIETSTVINPVSSIIFMNIATGSNKTGVTIGTTDVVDGQELTLIYISASYSTTVDASTTVDFASAATSVVFKATASSGLVKRMQFVYNSNLGKWLEVSRVVS